MPIKSRFIALIIFMSFNLALAYSEGTTLTGQVVAFDDREISILSGDMKIILPRRFYSKKVEIAEQIKIELPDDQFKKFIKAAKKANVKK